MEHTEGNLVGIGGESPGAPPSSGASHDDDDAGGLRRGGGDIGIDILREQRKRSELRQDSARLRRSDGMSRPPLGEERGGVLPSFDFEEGAEAQWIRTGCGWELCGVQGGSFAGGCRVVGAGGRSGGCDGGGADGNYSGELRHGRGMGSRPRNGGIHQTNPPRNVLRRTLRVRPRQSQRPREIREDVPLRRQQILLRRSESSRRRGRRERPRRRVPSRRRPRPPASSRRRRNRNRSRG
mmetsp:Transcript_18965/g.34144  ORF Transcript_18965/g.34144 Transcript_18965/m.34144 type:complete len:238 (+) Transcript_18965:109-822(+)